MKIQISLAASSDNPAVIPAPTPVTKGDWWKQQSPKQQKEYLEEHPHSKYAGNAKKKPTIVTTPVARTTISKFKASKQVMRTRPHSDEELKEESGEYFENDFTKKRFPNAFKNRAEMIDRIKKAPMKILSAKELMSIDNSDVGEILESKDGMKKARHLSKKYNRNIDRVIDAMKNKKPLPPSIVLRSKGNNLYLLGGNTRLMAGAALGIKPNVKVVDI